VEFNFFRFRKSLIPFKRNVNTGPTPEANLLIRIEESLGGAEPGPDLEIVEGYLGQGLAPGIVGDDRGTFLFSADKILFYSSFCKILFVK
jgi:hypothetical protein